MLRLLLALTLPALGIVIAALAQLGLTTIWPGIVSLPSVTVSVDGYFVELLTVVLCAFAGRWAHRNVPTIGGALCASIVPLVWFGLTVKALFLFAGPIAWFRPLTIFSMFMALAPLIGVALGWAMAQSNQREAAHAV
jgi:hypothetical protein